jgi:hypothetical protein
MKTLYFKQSGSWCAKSEMEHNGKTVVLSTYPMGGTPKTSYHEVHEGKLEFDFPYTFGYMLGQVRNGRHTCEQAHEEGLNRLRLYRPELFDLSCCTA